MPRSLYFSLLLLTLQVLGCGEGSAPAVGLASSEASGDGSSAGSGGSGVGGNAGSGGSAGAGGTMSTGGTGGSSGVGGSSGAGGTGGGGQGGSGGSVSGPITPDLICDRLAEIQCASQDACCDDGSRKHASRDECFAAQKSICEDELTIEAVASDSSVQYDPEAGAASFNSFEERALSCDTSIVSWANSTEGFLGLLQGTLGSDEMCAGNAIDAGGNRAAFFRCQGELTCMGGNFTPWTCQERSSQGGQCVIDVNCQQGSGLACDTSLDMPSTDGSCVSLLPMGGACDRGTQCESSVCIDGQCAEATANNVYCLNI